eukprot:TRINITY_DN26592_c0_g1_i1.p1 TRINITY_DN26592_c0_g1~~TRINITY_DN26592_c0_g1_i1.p1  ORF type:complete len:421 (+),score=54.83 TRINITY_DN26592_c0_g1_i1:132-1394(+)
MQNGIESELHKNGHSEWKTIRASVASLGVSNPIRNIVDKMQTSNKAKKQISLSIGDPTLFGNLQNPDHVNEILIKNITLRTANGYAHSAGVADAREALAEKFSVTGFPLTPNDVIIASGGSGALEMAMTVLANAGQNILLPAPGFTLYQTICGYKGISARFYRLKPDSNWEIDLDHMSSLIDDNTAAILINNPSNPCGSVFSKEHLTELLRLAERYHLPIISDEIYADMVFEGTTFHALAALSTNVPILTVGGLAKMFVAPGWRVGWILVHDRHGLFDEVRQGLLRLSQVILGANTLVQSIIRPALFDTPPSYFDRLMGELSRNADFLSTRLGGIRGLKIIRPMGAMYMMVGIDLEQFVGFADDVEFSRLLMAEESVQVLPGRIFEFPNYFRIVICSPQEQLDAACVRIEEFCSRHYRHQ